MSVITGTSTFQGIGFAITNNQQGLPRPGFTTRMQIDPIPYGTVRVVQLGGTDDEDPAFDAVLNTTDWAALVALKGTTGTLHILGDAPRQAVFSKAGNPKTFKEGHLLVALGFTLV